MRNELDKQKSADRQFLVQRPSGYDKIHGVFVQRIILASITFNQRYRLQWAEDIHLNQAND